MYQIRKLLPPQSSFGNYRCSQQAGFSLVEVCAAMGIAAFAFVSVLGLLSSGLMQFRDAMDRTVTAQIAARVINDAQQSEFSTLIAADGREAASPSLPGAVSIRYFDEQGNEVVPPAEGGLSKDEQMRVIYHAGMRVRANAEVPREETAALPSLAQVTVQVAHYSGAAALPLSTDRGPGENLLQLPPGTPIFTYSALVGRVQ